MCKQRVRCAPPPHPPTPPQRKKSIQLLLEDVKGGVPVTLLLESSRSSFWCFAFFELGCVLPWLSSPSSSDSVSKRALSSLRLAGATPGGGTPLAWRFMCLYLRVAHSFVPDLAWASGGVFGVPLLSEVVPNSSSEKAMVNSFPPSVNVELKAENLTSTWTKRNVSCTLFLAWRCVRLASYVYILESSHDLCYMNDLNRVTCWN